MQNADNLEHCNSGLINTFQNQMHQFKGYAQFFHFMLFIHVIGLKRESGRFSYHFREVFQKCIEYIGKL